METKLGKISKAEFGSGGYQDSMIGISFTLSGNSWDVGDFWGYWGTDINEYTQWTEQDRKLSLGNTVMRISRLLKDAKCSHVSDLVGVAIEVKFEGNALKSWRALTEVL